MVVKYAYVSGSDKVGKAKVDSCKVSYKNTHNTLFAIRGMSIPRAMKYLSNVLDHSEIVPFYKFHGGCSRHAEAKAWGINHGRFPEKSVAIVMDLLKQAAAHARAQHNVEDADLIVLDTFCGQAVGHRRRLYRAHGRVTAFNSQPCHCQIIVSPKKQGVAAEKALE
ncbi:Ribosomal protein L17 [Spironucleus salmonicida]|uniref:Ribosomal protein L17 n=1 Tax=Spironucleus salmonicida TaxID=348837 RepID=V6M1P8_9EUKA|nr:Ribosomal protein L17 [Spironucleus salmonicida]|eukprot:EST47134.1 Ribosomal protein L17 [Spironucleus salmonicida]